MNKKPLRKPNKKHLAPNLKAHFKNKKVWVSSIIAVVVIAITSVFVFISVSKSYSDRLSNAYDKCAKFFVIKDGEKIAEFNDGIVATLKLNAISDNMWLECIAQELDISYDELYSSPLIQLVGKYDLNLNNEGYGGAIYLDYNIDDINNSELRFAIFIPSSEAPLKTANDICNALLIDKGEVKEPYYMYYKNWSEYEEAKAAHKSYGTLKLSDGEKTLTMETGDEDYADKRNCMYSILSVPDRIQDAIKNTAVADGIRQDEWSNFNVEWYYRDKTLRIVIYQKESTYGGKL